MSIILPSRHRFAHDYALYLHDHIVHVLRSAAEQDLIRVQVQLAPSEAAEFAAVQGEEMYRWLEKTGRHATIAEMDYKAVFHAVATDMCHFVLEGLRATAKGKLTLAYALFRKPFRDSLFYMEWLVADPRAFLDGFHSGDPDQYELSRIEPATKRTLIDKVVASASIPAADAAKIYDLRYDRASAVGLGGAWDKALHLITTWRHNRTEPHNLNFIFSGPAQWETQWSNLYWAVPYLLYYATYVVDLWIESIAKVEESFIDAAFFRRSIGYELWAEYTRGAGPNRRLSSQLAALTDALQRIPCTCRAEQWHCARRDLRRFVKRGILRCRACGTLAAWPEVHSRP